MGSSHSSTHSTTDLSQATTPTNPLWVTNGLGALGATVGALNNLDPYSLVSGPNLQQNTAAGSALNLGGLSNTALNTSGALLSSLGTGADHHRRHGWRVEHDGGEPVAEPAGLYEPLHRRRGELGAGRLRLWGGADPGRQQAGARQ